jgi:hypothetical protein
MKGGNEMALGYSKPPSRSAGRCGKHLPAGLTAGTIGRSEAVDRIAARYLETVSGFAG